MVKINKIIFSIYLLVLPFFSFADELTDRAQQLIDESNFEEAFQILFAEIAERAGTTDYDLLLGIAAMDSGHPTQAVFAFERVLALEPDNSRARLELARAYFELGEDEASREEFTYTQSKEVPEGVRATIEEYLTAIDDRVRAREQQTRMNLYLQASLGYDTNVNSATDSSTVALPAFGNLVFTLDDSSLELDSGFYNLEGGLAFTSRIDPDRGILVFGGANVSYRPTWNEHRFDTAAGNGQLGLRHTRDKDSFLLSFQAQRYLIDDHTNRDQLGLNLQWLHTASARTQYSVFVQGLTQRFPDQGIRNLNQYSGGVGIVHLLPRDASPIIFGTLYVGIDDELEDPRPDFGRTYFGIRAGGEYSINDNMKWIASANYQHSKYGGDDPLFQDTRKDNFFFLRGGLEHSYGENWVITTEARYLLNDSNFVINDFDRWQVFATARYNF